MTPSRVWLDYRPVRIGWIVNSGDLEDLATAIRYTTCLWGGKFHPIVPSGNADLARNLVQTFELDLLIPVRETPETVATLSQFPYLIPSPLRKSIFVGDDPKRCNFADIYHAARRLSEEQLKVPEKFRTKTLIPTWNSDDPLAFLFSTLFGNYPGVEISGADYSELIQVWLNAEPIAINKNDPLNIPADAWSPLGLTLFDMRRNWPDSWRAPGLFVGAANNFDDLTYFWNLRAADARVQFYDPAQSSRLGPWIDKFIEYLDQHPARGRSRSLEPQRFNIWSHSQPTTLDIDFKKLEAAFCTADTNLWNGLNIKPTLASFSKYHFDVVTSYSTDRHSESVTFALPNKPFYEDDPFVRSQDFVVRVTAWDFGDVPNETTFTTPCVPELNEFYGRNFHYDYSAARSELNDSGRGAVGIITDISSQQITVRAIRVSEFLSAFFGLMGLKIEPSQSGLVCSRLIKQLGGVQGCRVLKVRGVRELLRKYSATQSFSRSAAIQIIGDNDPSNGQPRFSEFEDLYIEYRKGGKLTPQQVFHYLLDKSVFRAGLELKCTNCLLESWHHLDEIKTVARCELCGTDFNITSQLRDRDWRYRRSGLFGRDDDQHGSVAVALTIQQLHTALHDNALMFSTALKFSSPAGSINKCEPDFVFLTGGYPRVGQCRLQLLFGECKTHHEIDEQDVHNLDKLADAIPAQLADAYVMLAKTAAFSDREIELARTLNSKGRLRVILWSRDELEPYFAYERFKSRLGGRVFASDLHEMAKTTHQIYFADLAKIESGGGDR